jgi:hypothetical protein
LAADVGEGEAVVRVEAWRCFGVDESVGRENGGIERMTGGATGELVGRFERDEDAGKDDGVGGLQELRVDLEADLGWNGEEGETWFGQVTVGKCCCRA